MGLRSWLDSIEHHFEKGGKYERFYALYEAIDTGLFKPGSVTRTTAHVRDGLDLNRMIITVWLCTFPAMFFGMWNVGYQANTILAEWAVAEDASHSDSRDGSSAVTGSWAALGGVVGNCNGLVNAIAGLPDGSLVMGGDFSVCGDLALNHVAIYNPDTDSWSALGAGTNGRVLAVGVLGNEIYVGGEFQQAGSVVARSVARWDGSAWHSLGVGDDSGVAGRVHAIGFAHGLVYIGGDSSVQEPPMQRRSSAGTVPDGCRFILEM